MISAMLELKSNSMEEDIMFTTLARTVNKRPKTIIAMAVVLFVISIVLGTQSFGKLQNGGFDDPKAQSTLAKNLVDQNFGGDTNVVFLFHGKQGGVDSAANKAAGLNITHKLAQNAAISNLTSYWQSPNPALRSKDSSYALIVGHIKGNDATVTAQAKLLIKQYTTNTSTYSMQVGGSAPAGVDIGNQVGKSLGKTEGVAIPLTLIFLLFAFGTVVSAVLPLVIALLAIFGTFAELFILGSITNVSIYAINLTTALGLGLAIDYALFIVSRYREELGKGKSVEDAVTHTVQTAGRTVVFSATAVSLALATMTVFPLYFLRSFAYAGIGVVVISALTALIVLPAILVKLGHGVEKGRLPWADRVKKVEAPAWRHLAQFVMRHPAITALPVIALLLVLASPVRHMAFGTPDDRVLSKSTTTHQVGDVLRTKFTTNTDGQVTVVLTGNLSDSAQIATFSKRLSNLVQIDDVGTHDGTFVHGKLVSPQPRVAASNAAVVLNLDTHVDPQSAAGAELVKTIRALPAPSGMQADVGGNAAALVDTKHAIASHLAIGVALIIISTFTILFLFTGSVLQPLRALLSNGLTLAATFGVIVWIFQEGHFASQLNFTALPINISMPVLLFCIAFGLSMDYEVFLLSRIKEHYDAGAKTTEAVAYGMSRAGRIVTTLAVILAVSFFAFGVASISFLQLFGIGTGFAILIDATLVRAVLVPVFMRLLGDKAWYAPKPLKKLHERFGFSDS
jgi:RND superfamily putative drug exporter